jgi:hypothetical protein
MYKAEILVCGIAIIIIKGLTLADPERVKAAFI